MNSERRELVRGSDPSSVYSAHFKAGDLWRAPIRLLLKTHLAAGVQKTETKTLSSPYRRKTGFQEDVTEDHRTTQQPFTPQGMDRDKLFSVVTYSHVAFAGIKRSDHGLSLSRDRRSIVFGGQC